MSRVPRYIDELQGKLKHAHSLFRTKSIDALIAACEDPDKKLRRTLGPWSLTALGIGAVIGSGIFTLTGTAAAGKVIAAKSILNATVIDLVLYGSHAGSQLEGPARDRPSPFHSCWSPSRARLPDSAMRN